MKQVIRQAKKLGFLLNLYFMIGNPTETYDEMMQTFRFIKKFRPLIIQVAFCTPYPGSWVYEHLSKKQQKYEDYMHYDAITENLSRVPTKKLKKMKQEFYRKYYFSLSYFWNYLLHRAPYKIFNLKSELKVVMNTIRISFRKK